MAWKEWPNGGRGEEMMGGMAYAVGEIDEDGFLRRQARLSTYTSTGKVI